MIEVSGRHLAGVQVLDLKGKLLADPENRLWTAVQQLVVDGGVRQIVLNFKEVSLCDSYGIGELVRLHQSLENMGGRIVLCGVNSLILKVLGITHVDELLHIGDDEDTALLLLQPLMVAEG